MPNNVKFALAGVWFQAVVNALGGWFILNEISDRLDHGQDVENLGLVRALAYGSLAVAAVLAVCGACAFMRLGGVRIGVLGIEILAVLGGVVTIFAAGNLSSLIGIVLAVWIWSVMSGEDGRYWFGR